MTDSGAADPAGEEAAPADLAILKRAKEVSRVLDSVVKPPQNMAKALADLSGVVGAKSSVFGNLDVGLLREAATTNRQNIERLSEQLTAAREASSQAAFERSAVVHGLSAEVILLREISEEMGGLRDVTVAQARNVELQAGLVEKQVTKLDELIATIQESSRSPQQPRARRPPRPTGSSGRHSWLRS